MDRRKFLGAVTASSLAVLLEGSLAQLARAQSDAAGTGAAGPIPYETAQVEVSGKHHIHTPLWTRAGHSDGARLSPHKPDVAFSRAAAR
jgi:hypothetical protein